MASTLACVVPLCELMEVPQNSLAITGLALSGA
jgi:hypothetical protein